ncbi:hypothetical protein ACO2E2_06640 [Staphylococcus epidermidis]
MQDIGRTTTKPAVTQKLEEAKSNKPSYATT